MPESLGSETKTLLIKSESHKMAHEFTALAALKKTQLVKLNTAGQIVALAADNSEHLHIGYVIHDVAAGKKGTVVMRGYSIIKGISTGNNAGPVMYKGFDAVENLNSYATATSQDVCVGWALETAIADEEIFVVIKD